MRRIWQFCLSAVLALALVQSAWAQTATYTNTPTATATPVRIPPTVVSAPNNHQVANPTWEASATDMEYRNDLNITVLVRNESASSITVTVFSVVDPLLGRTGDLTLTVPAAVAGASGIGIIPPLRRVGFSQTTAPDTGLAYIRFSATTSVSVAFVRIPTQ